MKMHNTWIASLPDGEIGRCFTDVNNGKSLTDIDSGRCPTKPHKSAEQQKTLHLRVRRCSWFFFQTKYLIYILFRSRGSQYSFHLCQFFSLFFSNVFMCSFRLKYSLFFCSITSLSLSFEYNLMTPKSLC